MMMEKTTKTTKTTKSPGQSQPQTQSQVINFERKERGKDRLTINVTPTGDPTRRSAGHAPRLQVTPNTCRARGGLPEALTPPVISLPAVRGARRR